MRKALLIAIFALSGCGDAPVYDPELYGFYQEFLADCEASGRDCSRHVDALEFKAIEANDDTIHALGGCSDSNGVVVVNIDPSLRGANPYAIRHVLYHELGHCVLDADHTESPFTIMGESLYGEYLWDELVTILKETPAQLWQQMLDEFFAQ